MIRFGIYPVLGLMLAFIGPTWAHAEIGRMAPEPTAPLSRPKSSSWWLKAGEARHRRGEYVQAAEAFREALGALSVAKKRANEGARAAMLSVDAYWLAFESDLDTAHLEVGTEILADWLAQAGPGSDVSLRADVERMATQLGAVHGPLSAGDAALRQGDLTQGAEHYAAALDALEAQRRAWQCGAGLALRIAEAQVAAYDQRVATPDDLEENRALLTGARDTLTRWKATKPEKQEAAVADTIDRQLVEVEERLALADRQLAAAAEASARAKAQARAQAAAKAEQDARRKAEDDARARREAQALQKRRRVASIALLSTGAVATAAGAGLLGEGIAFSRTSRELADAAQRGADQMDGANYDRTSFDAELDAYRSQSRGRNIGMLTGGSVLLAGGIATGVLGAVWFARYGSKRANAGERAQLTPSFSRSHLLLSLSRKFR